MVSNDRAGSSPACGTIKIIWEIPKLEIVYINTIKIFREKS